MIYTLLIDNIKMGNTVHYKSYHEPYVDWYIKTPQSGEYIKTQIPVIGSHPLEKYKRGRYRCKGYKCKYKLTTKTAKFCPECGIKNPIN